MPRLPSDDLFFWFWIFESFPNEVKDIDFISSEHSFRGDSLRIPLGLFIFPVHLCAGGVATQPSLTLNQSTRIHDSISFTHSNEYDVLEWMLDSQMVCPHPNNGMKFLNFISITYVVSRWCGFFIEMDSSPMITQSLF